MPLPKAPTQKASMLSPKDYKGSASPSTSIEAPAAIATKKPTTKRSSSSDRPAKPAIQTLIESPVKTPVETLIKKTPTKIIPSLKNISPNNNNKDNSSNLGSASSKQRKQTKQKQGKRKLFVLDTNVLMHDPSSLFRFAEHDVFLPMITLEELDGHKKGMSEVSRNVRQVSRALDALAADAKFEPGSGISLSKTGHKEASGNLFFQTTLLDAKLPEGLPQGKADNQILGVVQSLGAKHSETDVILISKDINMRVKARALGLAAEDYENDKTLDDGDILYTGILPLPADFWDRHSKTMESWQQGGTIFYRISGPLVPTLLINQFVYLEDNNSTTTPLYAKVSEITGNTAVLKTCKDYTNHKNAIWGITSRNREQNFALNLLMDPDCDFISLTGTAGTGKTLITLASALSQVLDDRRYSEIIVTRVTVPVGEDIGFLPGTEEEKMGPWMGALDDNLEVLSKGSNSGGEWGRAATQDLVRSKIRIKSMNFMRGRTFLNKFVIIDEAQNLTPKQMKTLITRAGPGTKIVCLGNLAQIDTPYLTEGSSGLTYVVDRFKGWPHSGHLMLTRGERSRLADFASDIL